MPDGLECFGLLRLQLLVELSAGNGLAARKFGGDVFALKRLEDLAHIGVLHGVNVFKEGDQANEVIVLGLSLPGVENDGVLGLLANVRGFGVDDDNLGEVTVKVGKVLRVGELVHVSQLEE